jgi:hypothetical protein
MDGFDCCISVMLEHLPSVQVVPEEGSQALVNSSAKRPTGRVVGVIRRNWRTRGYAGGHLNALYSRLPPHAH